MGLLDYIQPILDRVSTQPVLPFIPQSSLGNLFSRPPGGMGQYDPGSMYGQFKQDPENTMTSAVMAGTTGPVSSPGGLQKYINPEEVSSLVQNVGSRFKTAEDLIAHVDARSGQGPFQLNEAEIEQIKEYISKISNPMNKELQGTIYKSYGGPKDIVLGVDKSPPGGAFGGSTRYIVARQANPITGQPAGLIIHGTSISPKEILSRANIQDIIPQLIAPKK